MNNPPEPYDHDKHLAWLDSLSADERLVVGVPLGNLHSLVFIALAKRALLTPGIKPTDQLRFLESMNDAARISLGSEQIVAMIEPMGDLEFEIFTEARKLDVPSDKAGMASFRVLTSPRVFWHFVTLNPSILAALKWREELRATPAQLASNPVERASEQATAPQPDEQVAATAPPAPALPTNYPGIPDRFFDRPAPQSFPHDFNLHNGT